MRTSQEMQTFMRTNNLNPLKTFKYMIFQIPVFLSVFTGFEFSQFTCCKHANRGIGWFTDLTLADPYYILPFLSMASLILTFEYSGSESPSSKSNWFQESLNNSRLLAELQARERLDAKNWQDAGRKSALLHLFLIQRN
ncbi:unnamed protein product [Heterobilharzia americana]|nr:unnamed protein product [Heterobilharzia americana]